MSKTIHKLTYEQKEGYQLDGKPLTPNDVLFLLSFLAGRTGDKDLEKIADYWVMLKESGHNGFYLKQYHKDTTNKTKAIRIGDKEI